MAEQHAFVAEHHAPRARDYVTSVNHSAGDDLDQIEALVRAAGGDGDRPQVLDLGCGGGHVSYRAAPHAAHVTAVDLTPAMLDEVRATAAARGLSNISVRQGAAERLPFADGSFDMVLCRFSAHHWHGFAAGLREAARVLTPGGQAVFADVVAPADPLLDTHLQAVELLRDVSHVRNYSVAEWTAALAGAGLALVHMTARTLQLDFPVWIARTRTPDAHAAAIRSLQGSTPEAVRRHFRIAADGSFRLDTATFVATRA